MREALSLPSRPRLTGHLCFPLSPLPPSLPPSEEWVGVIKDHEIESSSAPPLPPLSLSFHQDFLYSGEQRWIRQVSFYKKKLLSNKQCSFSCSKEQRGLESMHSPMFAKSPNKLILRANFSPFGVQDLFCASVFSSPSPFST